MHLKPEMALPNPTRLPLLLWFPHSSNVSVFPDAGVQSLSFEDPWLASASSDGTVALIDIEAQLRDGPGAGSARGGASRSAAATPSRRQLHTPSGPAYCVDIADQRVVCGSESETVRVWDFTHAQAAADRAVVARAGRASSRKHRGGAAKGSGRHAVEAPSSAASKQLRQQQQSMAAASPRALPFHQDPFALLGTSPPVLPPILEEFSHGPSNGGGGRTGQRSSSTSASRWYAGQQQQQRHYSVGGSKRAGGRGGGASSSGSTGSEGIAGQQAARVHNSGGKQKPGPK